MSLDSLFQVFFFLFICFWSCMIETAPINVRSGFNLFHLSGVHIAVVVSPLIVDVDEKKMGLRWSQPADELVHDAMDAAVRWILKNPPHDVQERVRQHAEAYDPAAAAVAAAAVAPTTKTPAAAAAAGSSQPLTVERAHRARALVEGHSELCGMCTVCRTNKNARAYSCLVVRARACAADGHVGAQLAVAGELASSE